MRWSGRALLAIASAAIGLGTGADAQQSTMVLGVQTHFAQGWPIILLDKVAQVSAPSVRDDFGWGAGEPKRGSYDFSRAKYLSATCRAGKDISLIISPTNPLYDGGKFARTPESQRAFAVFVGKVVDRFPCIAGIEVGNEINGKGWYSGGTEAELAVSYVSLLRLLSSEIKARHPDVAVLGGSTNVIGTGFLETLFAAGMLDVVDGVVVHPYRAHAEGLDIELSGLRDAMKRHGPVKPIWATEFGNYFDTPELAPPLLIKMVAMMSADGVQRAYWYVLVDEPYFKNMGLFKGDIPKPAAPAFKAAEALLAQGSAVRVDVGDKKTFVYRFGAKTYVMWGAPRPVTFDAGARVRSARDMPIAGSVFLGDDPVIATNVSSYKLDVPSVVVADNMLEFGEKPWSYYVRKADGSLVPLRWTDWRWTSRYTTPSFHEFAINPPGGVVTPYAGAWAVQRYTSPVAQNVNVGGCLIKPAGGDGLKVEISQDKKILFSGILSGGKLVLPPVATTLAAGGVIDFAFSAVGNHGGNRVSPRLLISRGEIPPVCM